MLHASRYTPITWAFSVSLTTLLARETLMKNPPTTFKLNLNAVAKRLLLLLLACFALAGSSAAQTATDAVTPAALAPGSPAGSYALSGMDSVNLYSGKSDFHLPLMKIGGRGEAQVTMALDLTPERWMTKGMGAVYQWWTGLKPGYGPGVVQGRPAGVKFAGPGEGCSPPVGNGTFYYKYTRTTLTFTASDGTEYELRDKLTGGQIATSQSYCPAPFFRGRIFVTADGTSATFIADADIYDNTNPLPSSPKLITPSGYLILRNGIRYRVIQGLVDWVRDRNGNRFSFSYDSSKRITQVVDSLGRTVTVTYTSGYDQINFKGFGGASRTVTVYHGTLSGTLRADVPGLKTRAQLFPELVPYAPDSPWNIPVVSHVTLPNNQSYNFKYNEYGDLARVELPTGGAVEYDPYPGSGVVYGGVDDAEVQIYRRMKERRELDETGAVRGVTTYSAATGFSAAIGTDVTTVTVDHLDPQANRKLLARSKHYFYGDPVAPLFPPPYLASALNSPSMIGGREFQTETLNVEDGVASSVLVEIKNEWEPGAPLVAGGESVNGRIKETVTRLVDVNLVSKKAFAYDIYNNVTATEEYGFGTGAAGPLVRRSTTTYVTTLNGQNYDNDSNIHLRSLPLQSSVYDGAVEKARTTFEYDNYVSDGGHAPLVNRPGISGFEAAFSTGNAPRGNVTRVTNWILPSGTQLHSYSQYDIAGNIVKVIDARGFVATVDYSDRFGAPDGEARLNSQPLELSSVGQASYAFATSVANPLAHTSYAQFDYYTGQPVDGEDVNGIVFSGYSELDPLDRPTRVIRASNQSASVKSQTTFAYDDVNRIVTTTSDQNTYGDNVLKSRTIYDGLGRTLETRQYEGVSNYIAVQKRYDALGRAHQASNPFRLWQGQNPVWTTTSFDSLGRVESIKTPDNAVVTTAYSGSRVLVTDQAGKQRLSNTNALGQLKDVWEIRSADPATESVSFPNHPEVTAGYRTTYSYDVLDSLTTVNQGAQTRTFVYDSLKRLTSATNPESGTIGYQYDNNGNLLVKTEARGVSAHYSYDALNRAVRRWYNSSSLLTSTTHNSPALPASVGASDEANYVYDLQALPAGAPSFTRGPAIGRLVAANYGTGSSAGDYFAYDALGRTPLKIQQTGGVNHQVGRSYDLAGHIKTQTYPSGRTVTYNYDQAGRLGDKDAQNLAFTGSLGDGVTRTYAKGITYEESGGLKEEQFGTQTPLYHKLHYNVRGQLNDIRLSTVAWASDQWNWNRGAILNYYATADLACQTAACRANSGPDNNGNLIQSQHWIPANEQMTAYNWTEGRYTYDSLNRLKSVAEYPGTQTALGAMSFTQIYDYDRYGNRTINPSTTNGMPEPQFTASSTNNRLGVPAGYTGRMDYDAAGNLVNDTYTSYGRTDGTPTRLYDAENRLTTAKDGNLQVVSSYSYNADGRRVRRTVNGVETWQVYGIDGELLGEYASGAATFVPTREYGYRNGELLVTVTSGDDQRVKRFLQAIYYGALQVDAPSQWMTDKTNELAVAGAQSQAQLLVKAKEIARALFVQTTYETNPSKSDTQYVTDLYYAYLQRGPDASGLGWWVGQAAGSVQNRINVCNAFEASGEFLTLVNTLYGTATSDGQRTENYVTNFYQGALARPPDSNELATNSATLNNAAGQGQSQVISAAETMGRSLFASQVNDASLSNTQYVTNLYEGFLQRGPDAGGLSFWSGQASVGSGRQNVLNAFATSSAFRELAGTLYREAYWLVADHLGTPRMVVNKSGSLASVKRHDYLPFGEELYTGTGGRTTTQGYSNDSVRQKFTSKERDIESGLDYSINRYYSNVQGRFTSVDPENAGAYGGNPQTWNGYSYGLNNPMLYSDPDGLRVRVCDTSGNCTDNKTDLTDDQWNQWFGRDKSIKLTGGKIFKNGELIGTYQQLSCDSCLYDIHAIGRQIVKNDPGNRAAFAWGKSVLAGLTIPGSAVGWVALGVFSVLVPPPGEEGQVALGTEADRRAAVKEAWQQEAERARAGKPTNTPFTADELRELRDTGKVSGYEGHHTESVNGHPESARDPSKIKFVKGRGAHLKEHGGNWRNRTPLIRKR